MARSNLDAVAIDHRALLFTAGVVVLTTLLFGLYPALRASGSAPPSELNGQRRRHEIAVRVAMGASIGDVRANVVRQVLVPVVIGLGVGIALSAAATRVLTTLLFGIGRMDPATIAAVGIVVLFTALLASYLPARRGWTPWSRCARIETDCTRCGPVCRVRGTAGVPVRGTAGVPVRPTAGVPVRGTAGVPVRGTKTLNESVVPGDSSAICRARRGKYASDRGRESSRRRFSAYSAESLRRIPGRANRLRVFGAWDAGHGTDRPASPPRRGAGGPGTGEPGRPGSAASPENAEDARRRPRSALPVPRFPTRRWAADPASR